MQVRAAQQSDKIQELDEKMTLLNAEMDKVSQCDVWISSKILLFLSLISTQQ